MSQANGMRFIIILMIMNEMPQCNPDSGELCKLAQQVNHCAKYAQ